MGLPPHRRAVSREALVEGMVAAAFVVGAAALAAWHPPAPAVSPGLAVMLAAVMLVLLRVEFDVNEGRTRPVQLIFVPMLVLLPAAAVPLVVAVTQVASRIPEIAGGRIPARRAVSSIADAWFALPPAALLAFVGPHAGWPGLALVAAAVALQVATDFGLACLRLRVGLGIAPRAEFSLFGWIYLVDVLLTPVAALAAVAALYEPTAVLAVLPLAALLVVFARERRGRLEAALELRRVAEAAEARLQSIVQNSSDLIAVLSDGGRLLTLTGAVKPVFGDDWRRVIGTPLLDRVHPDDQSLVGGLLTEVAAAPAGSTRDSEWRMIYPDQTWHHVEVAVTNLVTDTRIGGFVLTARDVSARRAFEAQLRHRAFHDTLTGLANRALFYDRVEHALAREDSEAHRVAVLFIDLDDFKPINDRHGHGTGDDVLVALAGRLRSAVRAVDTVARLGGDEFGVLIDPVEDPAELAATAERLLATMREPIATGELMLEVGATIGIAVSEPGGRGVDELLRNADAAMYAAKGAGKLRWALHDPALAEDGEGVASARVGWLLRAEAERSEIQALLERSDVIRPVFQPILDLRTGRVAGYEALARFDTPQSRPPSDWFAQAHRCGLGYELEARAIVAALEAAPTRHGAYLSLNLSPSSLRSPEVQASLPERLDGIVIEITENELMSDDPAVRAALQSLRDRGGRLAVDDAGAGYAGLKHVVRLAPDIVKLDRALVEGIDRHPAKAALVESFVRYGREMNAAVCAEGIETLEELRRLADLDVAYGQGWLIARPGAPWPTPSQVAVGACQQWLTHGLRESLNGTDSSNDRRLEGLTHALTLAGSLDEVRESLAPLALELGAHRVRLYPGPEAAEPAQVVADDPAAAPMSRARIIAAGMGAELVIPVRLGDRVLAALEVQRTEMRPWSRFEVRRALIVSYQIAAVLARLEDADPAPLPVTAAPAAVGAQA